MECFKKSIRKNCNFKKEIVTLEETIQNKENWLDKLRSRLHTVINAEETPSNLNKRQQKTTKIDESTNNEEEVIMMHERNKIKF